MKQYEITILTKEDLQEKPVKDEIKAFSGKILTTNSLGQKQLAYPIKKEKNAFFTTLVFEIEGEKLFDLNKKLGLKDEILRHLIIISPKAKTVLPAPRTPKVPAVEIAKKELEIAPPTKEEAPKEEIVKLIKPKVVPKKVEKKEETLSEEDRLKALDEKLDELLKE